MQRKLKKLINQPHLFFTDMLYKRLGIKLQKNTNKFRTFKKEKNPTNKDNSTHRDISFCIVIVCHEKSNITKCLESIESLNYPKEKIKTLFFFDEIKKEKDEENTLGIHNKNIIRNKSDIIEKINGDYTIVVSSLDALSPDYLNGAYEKLVLLKNRPKIMLPIIKSKEQDEIATNLTHTLSNHFNKGVESIKAENFIFDKIFGAFFKTDVFKTSLHTLGISSLSFLDGYPLLYSFLKGNSIKNITLNKRSEYLRNKSQISAPFTNKKWGTTDIYLKDFVSLANFHISNYGNEFNDFLSRSTFNVCLRYIKHGLVNQSALDKLTSIDKKYFIQILIYLLSKIGERTINSFNFSCAEMIKIGCLNLIEVKKNSRIIDIIQYDASKKEVLLRFYHNHSPVIDLNCSGKDIFINENKDVSHNIFSLNFAYERRLWVSLDNLIDNDNIKISIENKPYKIRNIDRTINPEFSLLSIENAYQSTIPHFKESARFLGAWVLMDRDNQADDNAEHLYRFIQKNHKEIPIYFVIRKDSHDWERLSKLNFNLIAYGSLEHEELLESCEIVISSHAAQFATDYFLDKRMRWKKFVFLQHGIIHNDQGVLFKPDWKKFDLFVTSATEEYQSIVGNKSSYKFTSKEVKLTGLPRHDKLLEKDIKTENIILVMPSWRPTLLGKVINGTQRSLLDNFKESIYATAWEDLLSDVRLLSLAKEYNYKIVFFPHANIQPYLDQFNIPEEIIIADHSNNSIQDLFKRSKVMITDYSSVAFEMAYLNKPVCYFQFDEADFFSKGHYNRGYFSYRNNGFGPVLVNKNEVYEFIKTNFENNCSNPKLYQERINNFFPLRDGKSCKRTFDAILSLNEIRIKCTHSNLQ